MVKALWTLTEVQNGEASRKILESGLEVEIQQPSA